MLKDKLKELREGNNLKQREIALILGITISCYSNYEQGTREPSIEILKKICDFYDISIDYLLNYKKPSDRINKSINIDNKHIERNINKNIKGINIKNNSGNINF